jgi:hypothetical protein
MAKLLEIYKKKESIHTEIKNINQIFSKYKTNSYRKQYRSNLFFSR